MGNKQLFVLGMIAFLVAAVSGLAWYHQEFYDNHSRVLSSTERVKEDQKQTKDSTGKESSDSTADLSSLIAKLEVPDGKREKVVELVQGLNKETETTTQGINELLQQNLQQPSDIKDSLHLLQQGLNIKLEQFKLDLSDEIGDAQTEKIVAVIRKISPPVLFEDTAASSSSHEGMSMDMKM
jgi:hypothetical protein